MLAWSINTSAAESKPGRTFAENFLIVHGLDADAK
jgi:hypothetical protein